MDTFLLQAVKDAERPQDARLDIPLRALELAGIQLYESLTVRVEAGRLIVEPVAQSPEEMELHAESFVSRYRDALIQLEDDLCYPTG